MRLWPFNALALMAALLAAMATLGCDKRDQSSAPDVAVSPSGSQALTKIRLALNWVPEPEFGGSYAAKIINAYHRHGLEVEIIPGGAGAPVKDLLAAGQVEFGIVSADEVLISKARGQDLVALFATYQTNPQGIMVHAQRGFNSLEDVFKNPGTLAMEVGLPYGLFLKDKYGFDTVNVVPYSGGVAQFLADTQFSQQCFVFSEPLAARKQGAKPQTFLIADAGYNPYTAVIATRRDYLRQKPLVAQAMVEATREGWLAYLLDPAPANAVMAKLNTAMDAQTFADAAQAQIPLIRNEQIHGPTLGTMTRQRWEELARQLVQLDVIEQMPPMEECFANPGSPQPATSKAGAHTPTTMPATTPR